MKNILLLTDFSINANNAINYAVQLFGGDFCKFYILNVQKTSGYITSDLIASPKKSIYDSVIKSPKKRIDALVIGLKKKYTNERFSFEGVCDYDSLTGSIKQLIKIKNIDMLVMGTNGASGIKETVFGSNTVKVLRKIDLPILVVPENCRFIRFSQVLFINETKDEMDKDSLKPLICILVKFNAQLTVLTVVDQVGENEFKNQKEELNLFFKGNNLNFCTEQNLSVENAINNFITKNKIELVSKIVNKQTFFERIFSESKPTNIAYANKVPLLFL